MLFALDLLILGWLLFIYAAKNISAVIRIFTHSKKMSLLVIAKMLVRLILCAFLLFNWYLCVFIGFPLLWEIASMT